MAVQVQRRSVELGTSSSLFAQMRGLVASAGVTLFALAILSAFLMPLGYMSTIAVKNKDQISTPNAPILPSTPAKFEYDGDLLDVYQVPTDDGTMEWALYEKGRESSTFI